MFPPSLWLSFFSLSCSIPHSQKKKIRSNATTISFMSHIFVSYLSDPTLLQSREDMSPDFLLKVLKLCLSYVRLRFCWKFLPHVSNSVSVFCESNQWPQLFSPWSQRPAPAKSPGTGHRGLLLALCTHPLSMPPSLDPQSRIDSLLGGQRKSSDILLLQKDLAVSLYKY